MKLRKAFLAAAMAAALLTPSLAVGSVAEATPPGAEPEIELLVAGLSGTSGSTVGPDGALYVPEGATGEITRIDPRTGETSTYASGLPKAVVGIGGAVDIAFRHGTAYILVTMVTPDVGGSSENGIYRVDDADSFTLIANLGKYSKRHPPKTHFDLAYGVQFALEAVRSGFLVTDGHHNRVLHVSDSGRIKQLVRFANIVPTGLAVSGRTVYMAEAGPVPHLPATGKVVAFTLDHPKSTWQVAAGYSLLTDVEFAKCGHLFAVSQGNSPGVVPAGSPALADSGELLRVKRNGMFAVVADALDLPVSVAFIRGNAFVTTLNGEVWKIHDVAPRWCGGHR
jgi:hypothetical protein